jgi:hypothetical protein
MCEDTSTTSPSRSVRRRRCGRPRGTSFAREAHERSGAGTATSQFMRGATSRARVQSLTFLAIAP